MSYVKRIVCLANSNKNGGTCVAGREMLLNGLYGGWIRPVSARPSGEISFMESLYANNRSPKLLDVIDLPLKRPAPHLHQTENHEIDPSRPWIRVGKLAWNEVPRLRERPASLWIADGPDVTRSHNCTSEEEAAAYTSSLHFIRVAELLIESCTVNVAGHSRTTHKAAFEYNSVPYRLSLTDPVAIAAFSRLDAPRLQLKDVHLTVSLTEPWPGDNNRCHKLVAAVICNPPIE